MPVFGVNSNCKATGTDIGFNLVTRDYLIDVYPNLVSPFKQSGLWGWGDNGSGGLGNNLNVGTYSSPIQTIATGTNWKRISTTAFGNSAGIKTDGTLWTWGPNSEGGCGDNTTINKSSPVQTVATGTNWQQVSCNSIHLAAIKTDGSLWTWGYNAYGELGDNSRINRSSPVQTVSNVTTWKLVSAGYYMTAGIKNDSTLWTWGHNQYGSLGNSSTAHRSSPVQTVSGGTTWKQVSCGLFNVATIKSDGTLWMWGYNGDGALGDNSSISKSSPVQTVAGGTNWKQVQCSAQAPVTAAIKTDGTLWTWGNNIYGGLGNNSTTNVSSPVQTVSGGTNWKSVSPGYYFTTAIKTDGTLWTWGYNGYGTLADNTGINRSSPVQTVSSGSNWKTIASGRKTVLAIRDDSADLWGYPT